MFSRRWGSIYERQEKSTLEGGGVASPALFMLYFYADKASDVGKGVRSFVYLSSANMTRSGAQGLRSRGRISAGEDNAVRQPPRGSRKGP